MKKLFTLLFLTLTWGLQAQEQIVARMAVKYDLDATSYTYCRLLGQSNSPTAPPISGPAPIKTSGSSTTVTENTSGDNPFTNVAVGDILLVNGNTLAVVARASAASITVDTAVDLSAGYPFTYLQHSCGTATTDGWISAGPSDSLILGFELNQEDTTDGIDVRWECRAPIPSGQPIQIYPDNSAGAATKTYTAAGIDARTWVYIESPVDACRIGFKMNSTDDGTDTGAARESINAYALIRRTR